MIETFGLNDVGRAAEHIETQCLFRKGEVGSERVGVAKKVEVKLIRVDTPWEGISMAGKTVIHAGRKNRGYLMSAELDVLETER